MQTRVVPNTLLDRPLIAFYVNPWKCTWPGMISSRDLISLNMTQVDASSFLSVELPSSLDIRALSGYQPVSFSRLMYNESLIL